MKLREFQEQREARLSEAEALLATARAETRDLSDAEQVDYDRTRAEMRRIEREIEIAQTRAAAEGRAGTRPLRGSQDAGHAEFRALMRGETRAMSSATDAAGGFLVPEEIDRMVQSQLLDMSPMRGVARVVSTTTADYKVLVNKLGTASGWAAEATTRGETATPAFAQIAPTSGELYAYPQVSNWQLDDALVNVESFVAENVSQEMAYRESLAFLSGDGTNKPTGFLAATITNEADSARAFGSLQYHATGAAAAFATANPVDNLIDLMVKLRPCYRQGPGVAWLMNSTTAATIRKFKDSTGQTIWAEALSEGNAARLLGYPVVEMEAMPSVGANTYPVAFGNFRLGYRIVDRVGLRVIGDEVTTPGWTKFYFAKRVGGAVIDSNAIKLLKVAAS